MLIPSRGRPAAIVDLLASLPSETAADIQVIVDEDDPTLEDYIALRWRRAELRVTPPSPRRMAGVLDAAAVHAARDEYQYTHIGFMGDDHRPRTDGWATNLMRALTVDRTPGLAYGNDLIHGRGLPTAVVADVAIVRALGRFTFPESQHLFLDNYWRDLGLTLSALYYLPKVVIEHMHPIAQKAEWDEGHLYAQSAELWKRDEAAYLRFVAGGGLIADAATIQTYRDQ